MTQTELELLRERILDKYQVLTPSYIAQTGIISQAANAGDEEAIAYIEGVCDARDPQKDKFCTCNEMKGTELHPCPYRSDVGNNSEPCCTCCDVCRRECAMDV